LTSEMSKAQGKFDFSVHHPSNNPHWRNTEANTTTIPLTLPDDELNITQGLITREIIG